MLGSGRPFILELHNPKKAHVSDEDIYRIQKKINENTTLIQVHDLQRVSRKDTDILKEGEEHKRKTYRCVVCFSKPLDPSKFSILDDYVNREFELDQDTPIRVLHRRTLATRKKMIYSLKYEVINSQFLLIDLETQAGTYPFYSSFSSIF